MNPSSLHSLKVVRIRRFDKPYMPGYFPKKISKKSMESPIPCAMIGTAKLRPVRR